MNIHMILPTPVRRRVRSTNLAKNDDDTVDRITLGFCISVDPSKLLNRFVVPQAFAQRKPYRLINSSTLHPHLIQTTRPVHRAHATVAQPVRRGACSSVTQGYIGPLILAAHTDVRSKE